MPGKYRTRGKPVSAARLMAARENPFSEEVLGEEGVLCLECGRLFQMLSSSHLRRSHGTTAEEYRETWGYNANQSLVSGREAERRRQIAVEQDLIAKAIAAPGHGFKPRLGPTGPARPQMRYNVTRSHVTSPRPHPTGADTLQYRQDVTVERIRIAYLKTGTLKATAAELDCHYALVRKRMKQAGMTLEKLNPPVPRPPLSAVQQQQLVSLVQAASSMFAPGERFAAALEELLREDPRKRTIWIVEGRWQLPVHPSGKVIISRPFSTGWEHGGQADVELGDGRLRVRLGDEERWFQVGLSGLDFGLFPRLLADAATGVARVRVMGKGRVPIFDGGAYLGAEHDGEWIFWFFSGRRWLFATAEGKLLPTVQEADVNTRRRQTNTELALAHVEDFDATAHEKAAARWLMRHWRANPRPYALPGRTILISGVLPSEILSFGHLILKAWRGNGQRMSRIRFGQWYARAVMTCHGEWAVARDLEGNILGARQWPHPVGLEVDYLRLLRGGRCHAMTLVNVKLSKLRRVNVEIGTELWNLRGPKALAEIQENEGAVLSIERLDGTRKFYLLIYRQGKTLRFPLRVHHRRMSRLGYKWLATIPEDLRSFLTVDWLDKLSTALPFRLQRRLLDALKTLPADLNVLAGQGPTLATLGNVVSDAVRAVVWVCLQAAGRCQPETQSVDAWLRVLYLLGDIESLAAMAALLRDISSPPSARQEYRMKAEGDVSDAATGFPRARIDMGKPTLRIALYDYRNTAWKLAGYHVDSHPRDKSRHVEEVAAMSWSDSMALMREDNDMSAELTGQLDTGRDSDEVRHLVVRRLQYTTEIHLECVLDGSEPDDATQWLNGLGLEEGSGSWPSVPYRTKGGIQADGFHWTIPETLGWVCTSLPEGELQLLSDGRSTSLE